MSCEDYDLYFLGDTVVERDVGAINDPRRVPKAVQAILNGFSDVTERRGCCAVRRTFEHDHHINPRIRPWSWSLLRVEPTRKVRTKVMHIMHVVVGWWSGVDTQFVVQGSVQIEVQSRLTISNHQHRRTAVCTLYSNSADTRERRPQHQRAAAAYLARQKIREINRTKKSSPLPFGYYGASTEFYRIRGNLYSAAVVLPGVTRVCSTYMLLSIVRPDMRGTNSPSPSRSSLLLEVAPEQRLGVAGNDWNMAQASEEPQSGEYPHQPRGQVQKNTKQDPYVKD